MGWEETLKELVSQTREFPQIYGSILILASAIGLLFKQVAFLVQAAIGIVIDIFIWPWLNTLWVQKWKVGLVAAGIVIVPAVLADLLLTIELTLASGLGGIIISLNIWEISGWSILGGFFGGVILAGLIGNIAAALFGLT